MNARIRSSVRELHAYTPGEQPAAKDVLKLNTNENPYPASPKVFEALAECGPDLLRKYPHPTARPLREAIARLHRVDPDQVLVGNGSDEVLALCTRAFCEPDGSVGYLEPSYSLYPVLADIADIRKHPFPLDREFKWEVPARVGVSLFFLTRPNAPTSLSLPLDSVRLLAERCTGVLLVDEAYADFADDTVDHLLPGYPNLLFCRTLSKSYSLAGLRLGYAVGPVDLIQALQKIKDSYNTDAVSQCLALAAIGDQAWMRSNVAAICSTRHALGQALGKRGFSVLPSQTNFVFARVPEGADATLVFQALRVRHVYVRHFPGPQTGDYLRITVGTDEQMQRFLSALDAVLAESAS
jgi:histidinol-phosphate aminotransferase